MFVQTHIEWRASKQKLPSRRMKESTWQTPFSPKQTYSIKTKKATFFRNIFAGFFS